MRVLMVLSISLTWGKLTPAMQKLILVCKAMPLRFREGGGFCAGAATQICTSAREKWAEMDQKVMDHKQQGWNFEKMSAKHSNADFGQKKVETLEMFRRAWEQRSTEPGDHSLETTRPQGNFYKCLQWREVCTVLCLTSLPSIDSVF